MRLPLVAVLAAALSTPAALADVTGRVIGPDGAPLRDVRVRAFAIETPDERFARLVSTAPERTPIATAASGADGSFKLGTGEQATVLVVADMKGRTVGIAEAVDGEPLDPIVLHERPESSGRVTAEGKGVAGAHVFYARATLSARTDENGRYSIPIELAPQEPPIIIHPDFAIGRARPRPDYSMDLDVTLVRGVSISGRVVNANDEQPVANAIIRVDGWPLGKSGEDGTFTVQHVPAAWRIIEANDGARAGISTRSARAAQIIKLAPAATVSGVVRDARADKPLRGAIVNLATMHGLLRGARTDEKGRYVISSVPPGTYQVFAARTGYDYTMGRRPEVHVAAADRIERSFALAALTRLAGLVIDETRKPVSGAEVSLSRFGARTVTAADGRFRLLVSSNFSGMLTAHKSGYAIAAAGPYNVGSPRDDVTITLRRGFPLQIRVVDKDRNPVPAASILIHGAAEDEFSRAPELVICDERTIVIACRTNASGEFETRVIEGSYEVGAQGAGFARKRLPVTVTSGTAPVVIEVQRAATITGRAVNEDGSALSIGAVQIIAREGTDDQRTPPTAVTTTAEDGSFVLTGLPASKLTLYVQVPAGPPISGPEKEVAAPATGIELVAPRLTTVSGQVVDRATGQPVREFRLSLLRRTARGTNSSGLSPFHDGEGRFTLDRVSPSSNLELIVEAPGYARATVALDMANTQPLEVKLDRAAILNVKVTSGGDPVADAYVNANSTGRDSFGFGRGSSTTDEDGRITLDTLVPGDYSLHVSKKGFVAVRKAVEVSVGKETSIEVELTKGREVRGVVVDERGKPVARARVNLTVRRTGVGYGGAQTDADGSFVLEGLSDSAITIVAEKQGYISARAEDVDPDSGARVTLTLRTGGTITGRVIGLSAAELLSVRVVASGPGNRASARPDATGHFEITGVPDGRVQVTAATENRPVRHAAPRNVEVVSGSAPPVEIEFPEGIAVSGRVTRNGAPVGEAIVRFMPRERPRMAFTPPEAFTTAAGTYAATIPDAGEYEVSVATTRGSHFDAGSVTVSGATTYDIDMRGSVVRGRVIDAGTGAGLPGANVFMVRQQARGPMGSPPLVTDADGRFVFDPVSAGSYEVRVQKSRYVPSNRTVAVVDGAANEFEIRLERGETVAVRVLDATTGKPIDTAAINVRDAANKQVFGGPTRDDSGVMTVSLLPGQYRVTVSAPQYPTQSASFTVPGPEVIVRLARGGRLVIEGRVEGASSVRVVSVNGPANVRGPAPPFRFETIAPGAYRLEILGSNNAVLVTKTITITSDATTTVTVP